MVITSDEAENKSIRKMLFPERSVAYLYYTEQHRYRSPVPYEYKVQNPVIGIAGR